MNRTRYLSLLGCISLATGCSSYWGRRPLIQPMPVRRHDPVWIWTAGEVRKWHAVVIAEDSISGIPYTMDVSCTSCRRSIARARVDSMQLGYMTGVEKVTKGVALVGGILAADFIVEGTLCYLLAPKDPQC